MAKTRVPEKSMPTYSVFVVDEQEGKDPFWLKVGAAFEHKDGKGLNIVLQALPVTKKMRVRHYSLPYKD